MPPCAAAPWRKRSQSAQSFVSVNVTGSGEAAARACPTSSAETRPPRLPGRQLRERDPDAGALSAAFARQPLCEHLAAERKQLADAEPDVAAHAVVLGPPEVDATRSDSRSVYKRPFPTRSDG
jgi:hypothetical protein